jgi:hypothetical protein
VETASLRAPIRPPQVTLHRHAPDTLVEALAFLLPFAGALTQTTGDALWRSDAATVAALEDTGVFRGAFLQWLGQVALHLPLGNHSFRLALPGALFLGLAGWSVLHLCHSLFSKQGGHARFDRWLALGASLSTSLSLPWLSEATVAGGSVTGAALALLCLQLLFKRGTNRELPQALGAGVMLSALLSESALAAGAVVLVGLLIWPDARGPLRAPKTHAPRAWGARSLSCGVFALGFVGTCAWLWLPAFTNHALTALSSHASEMNGGPWPLWSPVEWIASIGFLWCSGAMFALLFSLEDKRPLYALGSIIAADWLIPGNGTLGWTEGAEVDAPRVSLHLLALASTAPLGALGLRTLAESAQALRLFAARPLAAMVAVLAVAGCLASAEDSLRSLSETATSGTQTFTDEILHQLEDDALVITKSPSWGRRLLAAQAVGERPDIIVVPLSDLTDARKLRGWLEKEPQLEALLRDMSIHETPSERAITQLVDVRPVALEVDPSWDRRLLEHVHPTIPIAEFAPHALGRSDRLATLEKVRAPRDRILNSYGDELREDNATRRALHNSFEHTHQLLQVVKDGASARALEALYPMEPSTRTSPDPQAEPVAAL